MARLAMALLRCGVSRTAGRRWTAADKYAGRGRQAAGELGGEDHLMLCIALQRTEKRRRSAARCVNTAVRRGALDARAG